MDNNVVLYKTPPEAGDLWWQTDASLEENGEIRIIDGDSHRELHIIIAAEDITVLKEALLRHLPDTTEDNVLALLAQKFTDHDSDRSPRPAIIDFLEGEDINHKITVW